jgi:hypothetical protein
MTGLPRELLRTGDLATAASGLTGAPSRIRAAVRGAARLQEFFMVLVVNLMFLAAACLMVFVIAATASLPRGSADTVERDDAR